MNKNKVLKDICSATNYICTISYNFLQFLTLYIFSVWYVCLCCVDLRLRFYYKAKFDRN